MRYILALLFVLIFSSCSGGSDGGDTNRRAELSFSDGSYAELSHILQFILEPANSTHTESEDLGTRGIDEVDFNGPSGTWSICLEKDISVLSASLHDDEEKELLLINGTSPCATIQATGQNPYRLKLINNSLSDDLFFVTISSDQDQSSHWTTTIRSNQGRELQIDQNLRSSTPLNQISFLLLNSSNQSIFIQGDLALSGNWANGEQPVKGSVYSMFSTAGPFSTISQSYGSGNAGSLYTSVGSFHWSMSWDGKPSYSVDLTAPDVKLASEPEGIPDPDSQHLRFVVQLIS